MNSDQVSKWTTIITNIAVIIGLVFVGLEFRNNARAIEAERIDSFMSGWNDVTASLIQGDQSSEIYYRAHAEPESLSNYEQSRFQHYLQIAFNNFERVYQARKSGLIPDELWETHRAGIGFAFISKQGRETIEIYSASSLNTPMWDIMRESADQALAFCLNPENRCIEPLASVKSSTDY